MQVKFQVILVIIKKINIKDDSGDDSGVFWPLYFWPLYGKQGIYLRGKWQWFTSNVVWQGTKASWALSSYLYKCKIPCM